MDTTFTTIWLSDVHLGSRACRVQLLLDFLRETRCDTLYLVGDIIDLESLRKSFQRVKTKIGSAQRYIATFHTRRCKRPKRPVSTHRLRPHPQGRARRARRPHLRNDGDWVESCTALVERPNASSSC